MSALANQIPRRIRAKGRGWVFTPKDFLDLGTRAAVDQTLSRLAKTGTIRRVSRGIYDYPIKHGALGLLSPDIDSVASAVSTQTGDTAFASGAVATNYLGLSTQVPARPTYTTTGASKVKKVGGRTIAFKRSRAPIIQGASPRANYVLQALAYLGKDEMNDDVIQRCAGRLNDQDMKSLIANKRLMPGWMADAITKIDSTRHGKLRA